METAEQNQLLTQVGRGTPMGELIRRYWQPIAAAVELESAWTKRVRLLGEDLVLFRDRQGKLGLIAEQCPHRRASFAHGIPTQDGIRCPYHGWEFNAQGQCLNQPNERDNCAFRDSVKTDAYPVEELGGLLFAYLGPEPRPAAAALRRLRRQGRDPHDGPRVAADQLASLPETPGVYYFYNAAGKVVYVGKAVNLLKRVKSHFANNKSGRQKADFLRDIHRISYHPTATDLMAQILESVEIRRLWPIHNRSQRGFHPKFALYAYEDRNGYMRLALDAMKPHAKPLHTFNTIHEGHEWLRRLMTEFELCARLCNLAKGADCENGTFAEGCTGQCCDASGPMYYNNRVKEAIAWIAKSLPTLVLLDVGRDEWEQSCILVEEGIFKGMGYLSNDIDEYDLGTFKGCIEAMPDNDFIRNLVYRQASEHPQKCVRWEGGVMQRHGTVMRADDASVHALIYHES